MDEIKQTIAKNILRLRSEAGMTQSDLAEKLKYSDKAISKWERAESLPDITVIKEIANLFNVSIDSLVGNVKEEPKEEEKPKESPAQTYNKTMVVGISIVLIWFFASLVFVIIDSAMKDIHIHWLSFVYAVPCSMILWLIFDLIWFKKRKMYLILSLLLWSTLIVVYLTLLIPLDINIWIMFIVGVPSQVIIFLASKIKYKSKK